MNLNILPDSGRVYVITGENGTGKTRWLQSYSNQLLEISKKKSEARLICLSGTVTDKFPLDVDVESYAYFGRRTNNNMFSEVAPYRRLLSFLVSQKSADNDIPHRATVAREMLAAINLGPKLVIKFRRGRNSKEKVANLRKTNLDLEISLDNMKDNLTLSERVNQVAEGLIHIAGVSFQKAHQVFDLMDLSSGERAYALTVLALAFSANDKSVAIFDEPENSLHPKWQSRIMKDMWDIMSNVSNGSKLIVATHSPLVVSSAANDQTFVLNMGTTDEWTHSCLYGNSVDVVLKQQFNLRSPRAMSFIVAVRDCLKTLVMAEIEPDAFKKSAKALFDMDVKLDRDDPLFETVSDIQKEWERIQ
jgi:predicted ATPase